ncbi:hypothetical protein [Chryseobacterium sp. Leaf201]|uniref:hypothetical protein n=1 Tax=Chryseobacterium sp. Leaf201 TaxID=1735672 RepID=UPI0006FF3783|nr:hypothetical protein [Chryseobacterium sp. Leaf201]KQM50105.1 hypothetical protein ASE55_09540 [Chryseobacterium sp. Leaf201]
MKLKAMIREEVQVKAKSIIVEFLGDSKKQYFEVQCSFSPYQKGMRKWDSWELKIRFESEIFTEAKTGDKSYFTHLVCDQAWEHSSLFGVK